MEQIPAKITLHEFHAKIIQRALRLEKFFPELGAQRIAEVFPHSGVYSYPREFHLIEQGEPGRDLFVIYSGEVSIYRTLGSAGAALAALGPGDILGEIALVRDGVRTATAVVTEASEIYRLAYQDVQGFIERNPELAAHLNDLASRRLAEL